MELDEFFEKSQIEKYSSDVENKVLPGKLKNNKISAEKLTYSKWLSKEYKSMIGNTDLKVEDLHELILKDKILSEDLRNQLDILVKSNYHHDMYPVISRHNFSKNYSLENISITSSKKNRDLWNKFIALNRSNDSFDFEKKGVIQIDPKTNKEIRKFPTISEAKKVLGVVGHSTHISDCCKNLRETAYGFKWKFFQNNVEESTIF